MYNILDKISTGSIWLPGRDEPCYLLVALHGSGGSAKDFEGLPEFFSLDKLSYLFLNGPIRDYDNYRWYSDNASHSMALTYLQKIFDSICPSKYPPEKTLLLGFSQGADLVFEFGADYPTTFAGYIAVSGRIENITSFLNNARGEFIRNSRWLVTHGTKDFNLSIEVARHQVDQLRKSGFHIDFREYDKIHEFDAKEELPEIRNWIAKIIE